MEAKLALSLQEFSASKIRIENPETICEMAYCEDAEGYAAILVYADSCWILEYVPGVRPFKYTLRIENQEWESDDLKELEQKLYEIWYLSEYKD